MRVDLRVISSTNKNLISKIASGDFREELYHRLNVVPIKLPLENRREDIPILANHFVKILNYNEGLPLRTFSDGAITKLQTMSWPGNIRQLRNAVEQILILGPNNKIIETSELPESKHSEKQYWR